MLYDFFRAGMLKILLLGGAIFLVIAVQHAGLLQAGPFSVKAQNDGHIMPTASEPVIADILDPGGNVSDMKPAILTVGNSVRIQLPKQKDAFHPGRYTLRIWTLKSGSIYYTEQSFLWGVFALNVNKSVLNTGDTGHLQMAVLSDTGNTVCDADIKMSITSPSGKRFSRSTDTGTIKRNPSCGPNNVTSEPDYSASIRAGEAGTYTVDVSVTTANGIRDFKETFAAQEAPAFSVERVGPTRIYPFAQYEMMIRVRANRDYEGVYRESLPTDFTVVPKQKVVRGQSGGKQVLDWNLNLKTGDQAELSYFFDAPDIYPELFQLGPFEIGEAGSIFREARTWQLASDAAGDVILLWEGNQASIPTGWKCLSCSATGTFYGVFPRMSSTPGLASSSANLVRHALTFSSDGGAIQSSVSGGTGTALPAQAGTHTWPNASTTYGDIRPPYKNLLFIAANTTTLPGGIIGIFDVADTSTLPANWSSYEILNNSSSGGLYLRGGENATSTGGVWEHTHNPSSTITSGASTLGLITGTKRSTAAAAHTHIISSTNPLANASNTPPYVNVIFAKSSSGGSIPDGLLAMFDNASLPSNWTSVSTSGSAYAGSFLRGASSTNITQMGAATHNHGGSVTFASSLSTGSAQTSQTNNLAVADAAHAHNITYSVSSESSLPVYRDVVLGKYAAAAAVPSVSGVTISPSPIVLSPNATVTVSVGFTVTDNDGCGKVFYNSGSVTTTLYRSGVSSACAVSGIKPENSNYRYCYYKTSQVTNCGGPGSTTITSNATATFDIWYFADATDSSSSYSSENWLSSVFITDGTSPTSSVSASGAELNTLLAFRLSTSTMSYGTVNAGTNTGSWNPVSTVINAGNSSSAISIQGTALCAGGFCIATSSQHYATSAFAYGGGEQFLSETAKTVSGFLMNQAPLTGPWSSTTPLPSILENEPAFIWNGFAYAVGGTVTSTYTSTVFYAPLNPSGSIGVWSSTTPLPNAIGLHAAFTYGNYAYTFGGNTGAAATSTVFYAPLNPSGSIGVWSSTAPLPNAIQSSTGFMYNGFAYIFGGSIGGSPTSGVLFAPVNSSGSLGAWSSTVALPYPVSDIGAYIYNDLAYIFGSTSTYYAPVNSAGGLGAWTSTSPFPSPQNNSGKSRFISDGIAYSVGGPSSTVFYAPLNPSGGLAGWATTTPMSVPLAAGPAVAYDGFLYTFGGQTSSVFYAGLPSQNIYWGLNVSSAPIGTYWSTLTYTASWMP